MPFDDVADRLVGMIRQTATPDGDDRSIVRTGSLGEVPAERATALSMALAELLANAVEHGQGEIRLDCWGDVAGLHLVVTDAGPGFPDGFAIADSARLGLRIVDTLIREELRGSLTFERAEGRTNVRVDLPREG